MARWTLPLALLLTAAVLAAPPAAASGPCDNEIEEIVCDVEEAVTSSVRHLCDHWLHGCKIETAATP